MIYLDCDYAEGAHPEVLSAIAAANSVQTPGYGEDKYCLAARRLIKDLCQTPKANVHFLIGGTQANALAVKAALAPYQGVLCAETGHINVHEAGSIESTGHKVLPLPSKDGKLTAEQILGAVNQYKEDVNRDHIVEPGMVYISQPTETGLIYNYQELTDINKACKDNGLYLFIDGARLGCALTASNNDVTLSQLAKLCDMFTIGGTKLGALFGEALVVMRSSLQRGWRPLIKQQGGLLAKGRLIGIQFYTLLNSGLYTSIAAQENALARMLRNIIADNGFSMLYNSTTNQQFPILPDVILAKLKDHYAFSYWQRISPTHSCVRFCTSWYTKESTILEFGEMLNSLIETERKDNWASDLLARAHQQPDSNAICNEED